MMHRNIATILVAISIGNLGCEAFLFQKRPAFIASFGTKIAIRNAPVTAAYKKSSQDASTRNISDESHPSAMSAFFELAHEIADDLQKLKQKNIKASPISWNDQHLAHTASEIHEKSESELLESEAFFELAHEIADDLHKLKQNKIKANPIAWNDQHLAHTASEIHEETESELFESEDAAAWDAHDCSDPGMEAAAEERAVMLANELVHKAKEQAKAKKQKSWNHQHLTHRAGEIHEETESELLESEDAAAWDAHDCPDPGMEAAAEERAVMLANEYMHKAKEQAKAKKQSNQKHGDEVRP